MSLEEKLFEILGENFEAEPAGYFNFEAAVPQIIQAFKDEGWVYVPQVEIVTRYERGSKPELFMVNGKEVMTGQKWYDRFEKELSTEIYGDTNPTNKVDCESIPYACTCDLLDVAKKAAGL